MDKQFVLTKHVNDRLLEREIPLEILSKLLKKGVKIPDPVSGALLYIYNYKGICYTFVISENEEELRVITAYESSKWQIELFEKVKKREPKML